MANTENGTASSRRLLGGSISARMQQDLHRSFTTKSASMDTNLRLPFSTRKPKVCVVGAGVSGLRAADVLLQRGVDVTIFEARSRVGGRVHQEKIEDHLVDLGANWIHGASDKDPIYAIAKQTGTILGQSNDEQICIDPSGKALSEDEATELSTVFFDQIEQASKYSVENTANIPVDVSFYSYIEEKAKDLFPDERRRKLFLDITELWGCFVGGSIHTQSLKFLWLEQCLEGDNKFLAGTYQKVLQHIAKPALEKASVSLNTEVTKIRSTAMEDRGPLIEIETSKGDVHIFDEVVVTVPLGFLKRNKEIFVPPLPDRLLQAIHSLGYGNLDKVCITFPSAFWDTPLPSATSSRPDVRPSVEIPENSIDRSDPALNDASPSFIHWDRPNYHPSNPSKWNIEGVNLMALPSSCAHPTLLFYFSNGCSDHIASLLSKIPPSTTEGQKALIDFFTPYISKLTNYDPSSPECQPKAVLASNWANDRLAGYGSYCNFPIGLERGDEDIETMRHGMPERGIWLAGEHTAPFIALGTVSGAYWSGERVGKRMLEVYGVEEGM